MPGEANESHTAIIAWEVITTRCFHPSQLITRDNDLTEVSVRTEGAGGVSCLSQNHALRKFG